MLLCVSALSFVLRSLINLNKRVSGLCIMLQSSQNLSPGCELIMHYDAFMLRYARGQIPTMSCDEVLTLTTFFFLNRIKTEEEDRVMSRNQKCFHTPSTVTISHARINWQCMNKARSLMMHIFPSETMA